MIWAVRCLVRPLSIGILGGLLVTEFVVQVQTAGPDLGQDFWFYRAVGAQWLESGQLYLPRQLAGPHDVALMVDVLYPPLALMIFVPLAVLPAPLAAVSWWMIPVIILAATTRRRWWIWVVVLLWPRALGAFVYGNTDMWAAAAVAAGILLGWPAVLLIMKPAFAPLALVGITHRSWWFVAALTGLLIVITLPLWSDYARVMSTVRGVGLPYSLASFPLVIAPLLVAGRPVIQGVLGDRARLQRSASTRSSAEEMSSAVTGGTAQGAIASSRGEP